LAEMVLHEDGRFRWSRVDNLLREGSKSSDLTSEQMWLLGSFLCSGEGSLIRGPLVEEVARLLDAYAAGSLPFDLTSDLHGTIAPLERECMLHYRLYQVPPFDLINVLHGTIAPFKWECMIFDHLY
jgi:hypothetical protein